MRLLRTNWRWIALIPLAAVVIWWGWAETWPVIVIMLAPVIRLGLLPYDEADRRPRLLLTTGGIAIGIAFAAHLAQARMLGGFIQPAEVLFSAWFFAGCLVLLEALDRGTARLVRRVQGQGWRSLIRLIIIVALVMPAAVAIMQTVRVKVGYEIPPEADRFNPAAFQTTTADGVTIRGFYFDRGHDATLVVAHGVGAHAENFMPFLLPLLNSQPVNGIIFDFRGHGRSDGHVTSLGYHERKDLQAALDWLEEHHPAAAENLIFYGFSMGAAATLPVAAGHPNTRGIIIDSGFARLRDVAWAMADQLPPGLGHYLYYTGLPLASAVTMAPLHRLEPIETLDDIDVPLRVMHGGADVMIPPDQGDQLRQRGDATGETIPNAGHTGLPQADPDYFRRVGRFIELLLNRREASPGREDGDRPAPSIGPPPEPSP